VDLSAGQPGSPEHALALAELAHAEMWHGIASGPGRARAAARLARRTGSTRALAYALATEVMAVCFEGGTDASQARQAQEAAVQARDFWAYVHAVLWGISSRGTLEDRAVLAFVAEGRAELAAVGAPHSYIAVLAAAEAEGNLARGDWRRCAELLRLAFVANPGPLAGATVRLTAAVLACRRGRLAEGWAHLDRAEERPANPRTFALCDFLFARATLAAAAGDADAAVDAAVAGVELPVRPDGVERLLPVAAQALADAAERLRDRGHDPAEPVGRLNHLRRRFPTIVVDVLPGEVYRLVVAAMQSLYDAEAARGRGDAGAAQAWLRATEAARTAELLWEEAYASWRVAEALLPDRAQRVEGMAALRRAYEIASDLDANPIVTEVEALAREARVELGAPTALPAAGGARSGALAALTARERELLTHVVAGRTYREIARALQISEKTVSSHVSTILTKTGTANRVALAQLVRRLDANERP
jgi:DNA-binding CsgD family transcriptional regulator